MMHPMQIELRVLTSDDWALWRALRLEALAAAPHAFRSTLTDWSEAPEERWRARLELPGSHNLVALVDDRPVGMVSGVPGDSPGTVQLISMYVSTAARGTGLAAALLDAVEQWAADHGHRTLCLDVRADNASARRLYERQGYTVTGEAERHSPADPLELVMCKPLPS
jgi:ribosomal protein S18 acetylase RimI-like enzyme